MVFLRAPVALVELNRLHCGPSLTCSGSLQSSFRLPRQAPANTRTAEIQWAGQELKPLYSRTDGQTDGQTRSGNGSLSDIKAGLFRASGENVDRSCAAAGKSKRAQVSVAQVAHRGNCSPARLRTGTFFTCKTRLLCETS